MGTIKKSVVQDLQDSESAKKALSNLKAVTSDMGSEIKEQEEKVENSKKTQLVNLNINKEKYDSYKKMFGAQGYTFAQGNRMVLDFIQRELKDGYLELTESGFRKTSKNFIG